MGKLNLCKKHKPLHPHHAKASMRGLPLGTQQGDKPWLRCFLFFLANDFDKLMCNGKSACCLPPYHSQYCSCWLRGYTFSAGCFYHQLLLILIVFLLLTSRLNNRKLRLCVNLDKRFCFSVHGLDLITELRAGCRSYRLQASFMSAGEDRLVCYFVYLSVSNTGFPWEIWLAFCKAAIDSLVTQPDSGTFSIG